jgi:hypothetical protein
MRRPRTWALAGAASFAGVVVLAVAWLRLGSTDGSLCLAQQRSDIATMEHVVTPLLPKQDRGLVIATTGCKSGDPASISWDTTRPAGETLTSLARAGWTRLSNPQAMFVTDGYYRTVGKQSVTVTYIAVNSAFQVTTTG